jgi:translation initiation factor IF-3
LSRPFRSFAPREPKHRRNGKIRAREVRVVDETQKQLGVMSLNDALKLAQSKGLDLVETVPNAVPPVCRIAEYGKLLYEEAKRSKNTESRGPGNMMKEVQLTPVIEAHDFNTKAGHAIEFLDADMKVRVKLRFKGRQKAHKEFGFAVMNRFADAVAGYGRVDAPAKMLGDRDMNMVISPLPRNQRTKANKAAGPRPSAAEPNGAPKKAAARDDSPQAG